MTEETIRHDIIYPNGLVISEPVKETKKLWGSEHLVTNTKKYCAKLMTIEADTQVSLHYHLEKEETFILISGKLTVETIAGKDGKRCLSHLEKTGDSLTLKPGTPHTFYCPKDQIGSTVFMEASTQDFKHDSYRIYPSRAKNADNGRSDS